MTIPSAVMRLNGGSAGAPVVVTAGATITATLNSTVGVRLCSWSVVGTDDLTSASSYTLVQSGNVGQTVTFTALTAGSCGTLQCEINAGQYLNQANSNTRATSWFGVAVGGYRTIAVNETTEYNATFGYIGKVNAAIRAAGGLVATTIILADYAALDAYDDTTLDAGTVVMVQSTGDPWQLGALQTASTAGQLQRVRTAHSGAKSWQRGHGNDSRWAVTTQFFVNTSTGNDQAIGDMAHPLKTAQEVWWRRAGRLHATDAPLNIHFATAWDGTTDGYGGLLGQWVSESDSAYVTITTAYTTSHTGTINGSTTFNTQDVTFDDGGAAFDYSTKFGHSIVLTSGTHAGARAVIGEAIAAGSCHTTFFYDPNTWTKVTPTAGDAFEVRDGLLLTNYWTTEMAGGGASITFQDCKLTGAMVVAHGSTTLVGVDMASCELQVNVGATAYVYGSHCEQIDGDGSVFTTASTFLLYRTANSGGSFGQFIDCVQECDASSEFTAQTGGKVEVLGLLIRNMVDPNGYGAMRCEADASISVANLGVLVLDGCTGAGTVGINLLAGAKVFMGGAPVVVNGAPATAVKVAARTTALTAGLVDLDSITAYTYLGKADVTIGNTTVAADDATNPPTTSIEWQGRARIDSAAVVGAPATLISSPVIPDGSSVVAYLYGQATQTSGGLGQYDVRAFTHRMVCHRVGGTVFTVEADTAIIADPADPDGVGSTMVLVINNTAKTVDVKCYSTATRTVAFYGRLEIQRVTL